MAMKQFRKNINNGVVVNPYRTNVENRVSS